ncbi:MAG: hypothetical protein PHE43_03795 [Candidatus Nanoarchaeia archaeon]|nr:hypothetical protein [Candidatus Nanoarchaeia archaeon]
MRNKIIIVLATAMTLALLIGTLLIKIGKLMINEPLDDLIKTNAPVVYLTTFFLILALIIATFRYGGKNDKKTK